jgi:phenylalanyl-tRNA synthetase alpha subunit
VHATSGPAHIKIFIKAISSTYDEVALIKANNGKLTPPHNVPAIIKKTYPIDNRELVPAFTARWHSIRKISSAQMTTNPRKINKTSATQRKQHPPYNKKCRNQKTQSKGHYILQPELKYA